MVALEDPFPERAAPAATTPRRDRAASVALLSRLPGPVLALLCLAALTLTGWLAFRSPAPAFLAGGLWAAFLLRRRIAAQVRKAVARTPRTAAAPASTPPAPTPIPQTPASAVIMADLAMDGRLEAKGPVDLFGRLSGQVRCGALRVYAGGELRGEVACEAIGLAADATLEGRVSTTAPGRAAG